MSKTTFRKYEDSLVMTRIHMYGDWFVCTSCGYLIRKRVLGDTAHCPECGGTMRRK